MPLVRYREPFVLKDVPQMAVTGIAHNLNPPHTERVIDRSLGAHCSTCQKQATRTRCQTLLLPSRRFPHPAQTKCPSPGRVEFVQLARVGRLCAFLAAHRTQRAVRLSFRCASAPRCVPATSGRAVAAACFLAAMNAARACTGA